jgi:hypothetical protein
MLAQLLVHRRPGFGEGLAWQPTGDQVVTIIPFAMVEDARDVKVEWLLAVDEFERDMLASGVWVPNVVHFYEGITRAPDSRLISGCVDPGYLG